MIAITISNFISDNEKSKLGSTTLNSFYYERFHGAAHNAVTTVDVQTNFFNDEIGYTSQKSSTAIRYANGDVDCTFYQSFDESYQEDADGIPNGTSAFSYQTHQTDYQSSVWTEGYSAIYNAVSYDPGDFGSTNPIGYIANVTSSDSHPIATRPRTIITSTSSVTDVDIFKSSTNVGGSTINWSYVSGSSTDNCGQFVSYETIVETSNNGPYTHVSDGFSHSFTTTVTTTAYTVSDTIYDNQLFWRDVVFYDALGFMYSQDIDVEGGTSPALPEWFDSMDSVGVTINQSDYTTSVSSGIFTFSDTTNSGVTVSSFGVHDEDYSEFGSSYGTFPLIDNIGLTSFGTFGSSTYTTFLHFPFSTKTFTLSNFTYHYQRDTYSSSRGDSLLNARGAHQQLFGNTPSFDNLVFIGSVLHPFTTTQIFSNSSNSDILTAAQSVGFGTIPITPQVGLLTTGVSVFTNTLGNDSIEYRWAEGSLSPPVLHSTTEVITYTVTFDTVDSWSSNSFAILGHGFDGYSIGTDRYTESHFFTYADSTRNLDITNSDGRTIEVSFDMGGTEVGNIADGFRFANSYFTDLFYTYTTYNSNGQSSTFDLTNIERSHTIYQYNVPNGLMPMGNLSPANALYLNVDGSATLDPTSQKLSAVVTAGGGIVSFSQNLVMADSESLFATYPNAFTNVNLTYATPFLAQQFSLLAPSAVFEGSKNGVIGDHFTLTVKGGYTTTATHAHLTTIDSQAFTETLTCTVTDIGKFVVTAHLDDLQPTVRLAGLDVNSENLLPDPKSFFGMGSNTQQMVTVAFPEQYGIALLSYNGSNLTPFSTYFTNSAVSNFSNVAITPDFFNFIWVHNHGSSPLSRAGALLFEVKPNFVEDPFEYPDF